MKQIITYLIIIALIVIIPSFFGGMFKLAREKKDAANPSPSPSPIRYLGWPEYRNDTYHYKLKYPYDWLLTPSSSPDLVTLVNLKTENYAEKPHLTFTIKAENFSEPDLTKYPEISQLMASGREPRKLTISKSPALFFGNLGPTAELSLTFIQHRNSVIRLGWEETEVGLIRPQKDTMLQIIASFEFID